MLTIKEHNIPGYEKVVEGIDKDTKFRCLIALHDTTLGPALGGVRIYPYSTWNDAFEDVLRLAKGMTYKSAIAELGLGGGKAVIIANPKTDKTPELLHQFGAMINSLDGSYITAEDVGSTTEDLMIVKETSPYVAALPTDTSSGDPSPFTAWGVLRGIHAVAQFLWNSPNLEGKKIAVQGLGKVGEKLVEHLFWEGAQLVVCDLNAKKCAHVASRYGAQIVDTTDFFHLPCDILAPCALGGVINEQSISQMQCRAIAGSANNQLVTDEMGIYLFNRGIIYAPDFVINAGGIINAAGEFDMGGYNATAVRQRVNKIYRNILSILEQSQAKQLPTHEIAEKMALYQLKNQVGKRTEQIAFH